MYNILSQRTSNLKTWRKCDRWMSFNHPTYCLYGERCAWMKKMQCVAWSKEIPPKSKSLQRIKCVVAIHKISFACSPCSPYKVGACSALSDMWKVRADVIPFCGEFAMPQERSSFRHTPSGQVYKILQDFTDNVFQSENVYGSWNELDMSQLSCLVIFLKLGYAVVSSPRETCAPEPPALHWRPCKSQWPVALQCRQQLVRVARVQILEPHPFLAGQTWGERISVVNAAGTSGFPVLGSHLRLRWKQPLSSSPRTLLSYLSQNFDPRDPCASNRPVVSHEMLLTVSQWSLVAPDSQPCWPKVPRQITSWMGLSQNSVPNDPMVNDHYPY